MGNYMLLKRNSYLKFFNFLIIFSQIEKKTFAENPNLENKDSRFYKKIAVPNQIEEKAKMIRKKNSIFFVSSNQKEIQYENGDVKVTIFK